MRRRRSKGLSFYSKNRKRSLNTSIFSEVMTCLAGMLIAMFLAASFVYFLGVKTTMIGASMEPVLQNGQVVMVSRVAYSLSNPDYGDVIVFLPNGNKNSHYYVKRVVACPGDTVEIVDGVLYVNSEAVGTDFYDLIADPGIASNLIKLGIEEYFVMGDNCNDSEDSRSGNIGPVAKDYILGKAWYKLDGEGFESGRITGGIE